MPEFFESYFITEIIPRTVSFANDFNRAVNGREIRQEQQIFIGRRGDTASHIAMVKMLGEKIFNGKRVTFRIGKGNVAFGSAEKISRRGNGHGTAGSNEDIG